MSNRPHPEIRTATLADLYAKGFSPSQIGKLQGITASGVHFRLQCAGITRRPKFIKINTPYLRARKLMLGRARLISTRNGFLFNLSLEDIIIPDLCPVLKIPLRLAPGTGHRDGSPSLDRIIPSTGYVKGNVWVISLRANRLKSDASLGELQLLVRALESKIQEATNVR